VFGVFLAQKIKGQPLTVVGDGSQSRDFTYVTDVASAFIAAAASNTSGEVFNVGSGNHYSVNSLVALLDSEVVYIPKRPGEPDCTFADVSKIQSSFGWTAKVGLQAGVSNMLAHLDDWNDAPVWNVNSIDTATKTWFKYLGN
jgi:UDP-glucose 4-epimerase